MATCKCGKRLAGAAMTCAECAEMEDLVSEVRDMLGAHPEIRAKTIREAKCTCGAKISINSSNQGPMILHALPPCDIYMKYDYTTYLAKIGIERPS